MDKNKTTTRAFTLLEIVVVMAIVLLFMAFGVTRYGSFQRSRDLERETVKLADTIELMRTKTHASDVTLCVAGGASSDGIKDVLSTTVTPLGSSPSFTGYRATAQCDEDDGSGGSNPRAPYIVSNYTLPSGITMAQFPSLIFNKLVYDTGGATQTIRLKHNAENICRCIDINNKGAIKQYVCTSPC